MQQNTEQPIAFYQVPAESRTPEQIAKDTIQTKVLSGDDRQIEQRTPAWYAARLEMVTASDWATAMNKNPYQGRNSILIKKQTKDQTFTRGVATDWGQKYEPVAHGIYELMSGKKVHEYGLLKHPKYSYLGASPDGISEDGVMLEIKCPKSREITGVPPGYYWIQVQGQLEICDLEVCHFIECRIKECTYEDEYLELWKERAEEVANHEFFLGIAIEYLDKQTFKDTGNTVYSFVYSPVNTIQTAEQIKAFRKEQKALKGPNFVEASVTYWFCDICSIQEIKRDRTWFEGALLELQQFWIEVLYGRIHLMEHAMHQPILPPTPVTTTGGQDDTCSVMSVGDAVNKMTLEEKKAELKRKTLEAKKASATSNPSSLKRNGFSKKVSESNLAEKPKPPSIATKVKSTTSLFSKAVKEKEKAASSSDPSVPVLETKPSIPSSTISDCYPTNVTPINVTTTTKEEKEE
jgi:putative phage-type endonuclease